MPDGNENNTNPITQEEYDQLKTELEAERTKVQESIQSATQPLQERIGSLEADLQAKGNELTEQMTLAKERGTSIASLQAQHDGAVTAYRELVLKSNLLVPADMVQGTSIDDINASLEKASNLVSQIQQGVQAQSQTNSQANQVPAGAPGRTPPDLSAMTTREKITYGLSQVRKEN